MMSIGENHSHPIMNHEEIMELAPIPMENTMINASSCQMVTSSTPSVIEEPPQRMATPNSLTSAIFPCPMCGDYFSGLTEMKNHLEAAHRKFQCDICRKLMSHKRNVDRHRKSVHENQRGFGCPMCSYRSAHKQVVQRHLATKHQIKREESPAIVYQGHGIKPDPMLDIKPFLGRPPNFFCNPPPWLSQHDYNGGYYQDQFTNYIMEAANDHQQHHRNQDNSPDINQNTMMDMNCGSGQMNPQERSSVLDLRDPISTPPAIEPKEENLNEEDPSSATTVVISNPEEKSAAEKKPPMTAQVFFETNQVRIVFQRASNIHVVEVPFPEM